MNTVLSVSALLVALVVVVNCVKVSVYYEALCPDSVSFITRQLYPHYPKLAEHVELELIPYGKAIHSRSNGKWAFSCQHGPSECTGNKYQSCVLALNSGAQTDVNFVNCIMRQRNPSRLNSVETCAKRFDLDVPKIKACSSSDEGDELLALNGNKTWELDPTISFVPTIVYNDAFEQLSQDQSLQDFVAVVCSKINATKPAICKNRALPTPRFWGYF